MVSLATVSLLQPVTTQLVTSESHADNEELKLIRLASRVKVGLRATVDGSEIRRENHRGFYPRTDVSGSDHLHL